MSFFFLLFLSLFFSFFFFFTDTATTEIYTLSLHDALPICRSWRPTRSLAPEGGRGVMSRLSPPHRAFHRAGDRKSTRLNLQSRFDLVCRLLLEKKKKKKKQHILDHIIKIIIVQELVCMCR